MQQTDWHLILEIACGYLLGRSAWQLSKAIIMLGKAFFAWYGRNFPPEIGGL